MKNAIVLHRDVPVFCRRLHDREADLQRRKTPTAAVQYWFAIHQHVVGLVEFRGVGVSSLGEWYLCRACVIVDVDTSRRLTHLAVLARHKEEPEVVQKTGTTDS